MIVVQNLPMSGLAVLRCPALGPLLGEKSAIIIMGPRRLLCSSILLLLLLG